MKNTEHNKLAWLIDKNLKAIKFELYSLPIQLNHFYKIYLWYILFTVIVLIMCYITRKQYDRFMYKYLIIGYIFAFCIAYLSEIIFNAQPWLFIYIDKDGNRQAFREKHFREQGSGVLQNGEVIMKGGDNLKDKNKTVYVFKNKKLMGEFIKKNNIQTRNFGKYILEKEQSSNNPNWKGEQSIHKWGDLKNSWNTIQQHVHVTFTIILTFMLIVAAWNKTIFFKLMPWFILILAIESIVGTTWNYYSSLPQRNNYMFYM